VKLVCAAVVAVIAALWAVAAPAYAGRAQAGFTVAVTQQPSAHVSIEIGAGGAISVSAAAPIVAAYGRDDRGVMTVRDRPTGDSSGVLIVASAT
jgi:hypothetical protein